MTDERRRDSLSTNFSLLSERLAEEWPNLTNKQVEELEKLKERAWGVVCRRNKARSSEI